MFNEEQRVLLEQVTFAKLATVGPTGAPESMVIWFRLEGDEIRMFSPANLRKVRNLQRDPRVSLVIEDRDDPYHYLEIRSRAEIISDPSLVGPEMNRIATRYIGEQSGPYLSVRPPESRVLIVVKPEYVRSYNERP